MDANTSKSFGLIKWFGGRNGKTGKDNNFGFIQDASGQDVYLNKSDWEDPGIPAEGELLAYVVTQKKGKLSAQNASRLSSARPGIRDLYTTIQALRSTNGAVNSKPLEAKLCSYLCATLPQADPDELQQIVDCNNALLYEIIARHPRASDNFDFIIKNARIDLTDVAWTRLPDSIIETHESTIAQQFSIAKADVVLEKCCQRKELPTSLIVFLLIKGVFSETLQLGRKNSELVYLYLNAALFRKTRIFPDYLQSAYDADLALNGGAPSNPLLMDILDSLRFKHSLYEKTHSFIDIFAQSSRLQRNLETFVLGNLFSLIASKNSDDVVFSVFLQRFWEGLISGALRLEKQEARIKKLFPPCQTMHENLSCEAVYWSKEDMYLCRGKRCALPSVIPRTSKDYLEFNIYDWLAHYGIQYSENGKPASRDFPIKLAGYINRIREIYEVIYCRSCADLMLPDMRYARTEYTAWENGVAITKEMAAAYRLTVFHCNHPSCSEFDRKHYINHCVGCYRIIDSRTLKRQCGNGMYVCDSCGSCCAKHRTSHPSGLCPRCTAPLKVHEKEVMGYKYVFKAKYVQCSDRGCGFTIDYAELPSRFKSMPAVAVDD